MPLLFKLMVGAIVGLWLLGVALIGTVIVSNFHYLLDPVALLRDVGAAAAKGFREEM